eukprot:1137343-Pelagomonas_calceolata.AAC.10
MNLMLFTPGQGGGGIRKWPASFPALQGFPDTSPLCHSLEWHDSALLLLGALGLKNYRRLQAKASKCHSLQHAASALQQHSHAVQIKHTHIHTPHQIPVHTLSWAQAFMGTSPCAPS